MKGYVFIEKKNILQREGYQIVISFYLKCEKI